MARKISLSRQMTTPRKSPSKENDTNFFEQVCQIARLIPFGRVTSYGLIAKYLGAAKSSRMVGWALHSTKNTPASVPAHRVVNRNGLLTGKTHFGGPTVMQQLLENEGIKVKDDKIVDFKKILWDPLKELNIPNDK